MPNTNNHLEDREANDREYAAIKAIEATIMRQLCGVLADERGPGEPSEGIESVTPIR